MVFSHSDRLRLSREGSKTQLQFGDVLRWKEEGGIADSDNVSLVVTPACDLVRDSVERVTLLSGKLESLQPRNWSYKAAPVRTPIVILPDEDRRWIRWSLKDVQTVSWRELDALLEEQGNLVRIGRLREIYAIEIQQKMLADMGRVGQPANLPVPFPVSITLFYVDTDYKAQRLDIEEIESAVCYVGRGRSPQPVHRLVLTEQTCDHIQQALQGIEDNRVHRSAKPSLAAIKEDRSIFTRFERGEIEISTETGTKYIRSDDNKKVYASIIRGGDFGEGSSVTKESRKAALIVKIRDISTGDTD